MDPGTPADVRDPRALPRPRRPTAIEFAAAILIVGSSVNVIQTMAGGTVVGGVAVPPIFLLASTGLDALLVVIGFAIRAGRWWVLAINVTAVVVFLYGTSALDSGLSEIPLVFSVLYGAVFVMVFLNRSWFTTMATWRQRRG